MDRSRLLVVGVLAAVAVQLAAVGAVGLMAQQQFMEIGDRLTGIERLQSDITAIKTSLLLYPPSSSDGISVKLDGIAARLDTIDSQLGGLEADITALSSKLPTDSYELYGHSDIVNAVGGLASDLDALRATVARIDTNVVLDRESPFGPSHFDLDSQLSTICRAVGTFC